MIAWLDLETTGLDPSVCSIIEVALVITNDHLEPVGDSFVRTVCPPIVTFWQSDAIVMHRATGLYEEAVFAPLSTQQVQEQLGSYLEMFKRKHKIEESMPLAGSTIGFDRSFLKATWPKIHDTFHYRSIDVSSFKELVSRTFGIERELLPPEKALTKHRALADVQDSLAAMRWYKLNCLTIPESLRVTVGSGEAIGR